VLAPWTWFVIRGVHPWLEFVATGLPILIFGAGGIALLLSLIRRSLIWVATVGSLGLFFLVTVVLPMRPVDGPDPIDTFGVTFVKAGGAWFSDNDVGYLAVTRAPELFVAAEIAESHDKTLSERYEFSISDIIPLERSQANLAGLGPQTDDYRRFGLPSIGVYSNFPLTRMSDPLPGEIQGGLPGIRVQMSTEQGDVVVYALHVPRAGRGGGVYEVTISEQSAMIDAISNAISEETLPVVVVGDLNITDRNESYRKLTNSLTDGMRQGRWAGPTQVKDVLKTFLLLRSDHLLVSDRLCVARAATERLVFSDDKLIAADVGLCPVGR